MKFLDAYRGKVFGSVSGLDRIRFRGTLRWLANSRGMGTFLSGMHILLKDFGKFAEGVTKEIRGSCAEAAAQLGIPTVYLDSSSVDKESEARRIAFERKVSDAPICMFSVVEPCVSPIVAGNRDSKRLELTMKPRKCVWVYYYFDHPEYGFGHVRLQTWFPFNVNICLNGRHWLEKRLVKNGIRHLKDGNCFPWIEDIGLAEKFLDEQLRTPWDEVLSALVKEMCPGLADSIPPCEPRYYWSADETEWATDIMFRSTDDLAAICPRLIRHGMLVSDSPAVMRFFGRRSPGKFGKGRFPAEIVSDTRRRYEGIRNKHWINNNSVKMYNKCGSVLRFETTINNTRDFKVYRHPDNKPESPLSWQKMRKGVADLHRRCQISGKCNERYSDSLCSMDDGETMGELVGGVCNRATRDGRKYRGINPWDDGDLKMLEFIARGELSINGFRNRDLRNFLFQGTEKVDDKKEQRRISGRVSRKIALLRAHGLIRKVPNVNRYMTTGKGMKIAAAVKCATNIELNKIMGVAA